MEVISHNHLGEPSQSDVVAEMVDISEEMAANDALQAREQLLAQLTEMGSGLGAQLSAVLSEDRAALNHAVRNAITGAGADVEVRIRRAGEVGSCHVSIRPLLNDVGVVTGLTGCIEDVTERVRARQELEARAARDPLTSCLNREATLATLQGLLDRKATGTETGRSGTAVMFIDLDGFKPINDEFGHAAGDEVLVRLAERLRASVRAGDVLGRFGGDEFVVVCPDVPASADALALALARALARRVLGPLHLQSATVDIKASIGVAWNATGQAQAACLIGQADAAMYDSKRAGQSEPALAAPA